MLLPKRKYKSQDEAFATAGRGRYIKKDPPSPSVKGIYQSDSGQKPASSIAIGRRLYLEGKDKLPIASMPVSYVLWYTRERT